MGAFCAYCLLLLVGSSWWLRRFFQGPLEAVQKRALRR
ncbi:DUF418 domain-containing protein [Streptomyces gobiensis]|nr:DUF418 domain-containing protein [Streptomyces gobiensis]UGY95132.1 DUF418 domain-containing protein [Streptomyces gobiensis]